ncbi:hypothetical protein LX15_002020 [Streptoalloteichus tenebrarius]|uniref:Alkaline shock response membrane anchor protein AmaP n=1 Tax=Streptoalloteichus tenebrarius (strain ATCC 17920 / DSM 40477 / JCM 4838 / CBS 697.72 / NBRC 16177 / NCIMB 11028 / NRRL B-12390 / A12253. 1 / ISP 5477) TaxID=1933 RepID=A0ABT1HS33_STRSD|nr:alkaline shock response membrane anchor protein AmaP [Streptoalloteichus tenebrarius]MCP2258326.1 hypothetical protein [Streptoalloteichus tenebrarius]BFF03492.1 hypothetical protein GCM10020241_51670 [Streptoalloteichus tenebrarius]
MSDRSAAAVARSARGERVTALVIGLVLVLAGVAALVVGAGWVGTFRAHRPLLDPLATEWLAARGDLARVGALVLGLLALVLGLRWAAGALRPEHRPDLVLDREPGTRLTVTGGAVADAVRADAEAVEGVTRARARLVGGEDRPALRLTLWLREGADVRAVWEELDRKVLDRARTSLGVDRLPTAVRLELEAAERRRVR